MILYTKAGKLLTSWEIDAMFDEMLDECNERINMAGLSYRYGYAWRAVDPLAYEIGRKEYVGWLVEDGTLAEVAHDQEE